MIRRSRRPTPRGGREESGDAVILALVLVVALLAGSIVCGLTHRQPDEVLTSTYTYDGEEIRWYVLTDPETGAQYLVNDRGGCTPRLEADPDE